MTTDGHFCSIEILRFFFVAKKNTKRTFEPNFQAKNSFPINYYHLIVISKIVKTKEKKLYTIYR